MHPVIPALPSLWPSGYRVAADILRIAHRGGAAGTEDYRAANLHRIRRVGAHLVEVDLRATREGHLVAHHDPTIHVDGDQLWIRDHTLTDLRRLVPEERLPAAETVLDAVHDAGLGLYLDIKDVPPGVAAHLVEILTAKRMTTRTIIASADPEIVAAFAETSNTIPRAVLFIGRDDDPVRLARLARADFVHPCWEGESRPDRLLTPPWLDAVRAQGLGVVCWHEERPAVLAALRDLGVDGICTDTPEALVNVLSG